jgi:ribosomal protein S18 acetylase RimI-like enzyme
VNYLAVAPEHQRRGFGRLMMATVEERFEAMGCPKVNVQVRGTNPSALQFYERLGYVIDDTVSLGKRVQRDEPE